MSHTVRVLCRPEVAAGFALAGLRPAEVADGPEAAVAVRELLAPSPVGVVLVDEGLYREFPGDLLRRLGRRPLPMVVPFPGPDWAPRPEAAEAYIVELLRQVIGYRVRLR